MDMEESGPEIEVFCVWKAFKSLSVCFFYVIIDVLFPFFFLYIIILFAIAIDRPSLFILLVF